MTEAVPELRIAAFGPSGSGKTTLLASYYGNQQRDTFETDHGYHLEAETASQGNDLLQCYYFMEDGKFPENTDDFREFRFDMRVLDVDDPGLKIVWYDYPGGWWSNDPQNASEKNARDQAIAKLLTSHVGLLVIDGEKYRKDGISCVRQQLDQFRNEIKRITRRAGQNGQPIEDFPGLWIIALSKADLFGDKFTAKSFCKDVVKGANEQLSGLAKAVDSDSFGKQFLLLSSVDAEGNTVKDATKFIGLQLLAPLAMSTMLSKAAEDAAAESVPSGPAWWLGRAADALGWIDSLDDILPPKYQLISQLLKVIAVKDIIDGTMDDYKQQQQEAAAKGKAIEAAVATMRMEMAHPDASKAYFENQK